MAAKSLLKAPKRDGYPSGVAAKLQAQKLSRSCADDDFGPRRHDYKSLHQCFFAEPDISGLVVLAAVLFMPMPAVVSLFGMAIRIQPG